MEDGKMDKGIDGCNAVKVELSHHGKPIPYTQFNPLPYPLLKRRQSKMETPLRYDRASSPPLLEVC